MTVAELLERVSSREISEWMAFSQLEPFGSQVGFLGHAITAATVANVHRGKGKKAYKPDDFMPQFGPKEPQTVEEMLQIAQTLTIGLGGKDLRKDR
jgi:hypothetical protein